MNIDNLLEEADKALNGIFVSGDDVFKMAKARTILKDAYSRILKEKNGGENDA